MRSVSAGGQWQHEDLSIHGISLSGVRTSFAFPELHMAVDVAQGFPFVIPMKKYFITHPHLDHASGIPYIISQKALHRVPGGDYYMPESMVEPLDRVMKLWQTMEEHKYNYNFVGLKPMEAITLNSFYSVRCFEAFHRIPSLGYTLFHGKKKLHPKYSHCSPDEIQQLRKTESIEIREEYPLWTYSGDSCIEFLDSAPWIKQSKILFIETTYIDETKTVTNARDRGHIHLDELVERLPEIQSEKIVLCHISSRYSLAQIQTALKQRVPSSETDRIEIFPFQ